MSMIPPFVMARQRRERVFVLTARPSTTFRERKQDVDARDTRGHDGAR